MVLDTIRAYGHQNILCSHSTTIEITKDKSLTKKGNCILGIKATKACKDLTRKLKVAIKNGQKIEVTIQTENKKDCFVGYGHKDLPLRHKKDIVFRKSNYICDRTVLINCSKSSRELSRELITEILSPDAQIYITFNDWKKTR
ncbi:MAG: hypothetical protein BAJALOKI1v1_650016 [Promethearchaeota archaeon]|nr:MAG: hypothetical protein BAJALOKI1v1_650016 [Candidatus Lokiarchaeota archaeon]